MIKWRVLIVWSTGKETLAGFRNRHSAVAWMAGRVGEIDRQGWLAEVRLLKRRRRHGAAVEWDDVTYAQLLPGPPHAERV